MIRPRAVALALLLSLLAPPAAAQSAAPIIRVHAHAEDNEARVRVVSMDPNGASCSSGTPTDPARERWGDCVVDVPAGSQLSITLGDHVEAPHPYWVPDDRGSELDLKVVPNGYGAIMGGGAMIIVGSISAFFGGLLLYAASESPCHCDKGTTEIAVVTIAGAVLVLGGIAVIAGRSREPRVETLRPRRATDRHGRKADFLGDVAASTRSREPSMTVPPPFTPLGYAFTF